MAQWRESTELSAPHTVGAQLSGAVVILKMANFGVLVVCLGVWEALRIWLC